MVVPTLESAMTSERCGDAAACCDPQPFDNDRRPRLDAKTLALTLAFCAACRGSTPGDPAAAAEAPTIPMDVEWTQFGGPAQNFKVPDYGLAETWPREGPPRLWTRKLGPGYSGIVARRHRLYTMYRSDPEEVVVCLDARNGETIWEYRYASSPAKGHDHEYGDGPNASPLLAGDRVYTIGVAGVMHCLDADDGRVLWSRDLWLELGGTFLELGYSSGPIAYKDHVIVLVGGKDRGAVALDQEDGHVVWKGLSFENSYSTPMIMNIHGEDQLIAFMATEVIGADPNSGVLKWRYLFRNSYPQNICMPSQAADDLLVISTLETGSRGLRIAASGSPLVEEAWATTRFQCFYSSTVLLGDHLYGVSGYQSSPRLIALDARTGELAWRKRGFAVANLVAAGDHLLILDEEGKLTLATPGPDGVEVHAEARVLVEPARTPPTIVGTVLFARDFHSVVALDLGR